MKRSYIKKIGKVGEANKEARNRIAEIAEEKGLNYCEVGLEGCLGTSFLAPAHRFKRSYYMGDVEILSDYKHWVSCCQVCHDRIEHNEELTKETFIRLRGK